LSEALVVLRDQRDRLLTVQCRETLAAVLAGSGEYLRATRIFGALQARREALGMAVELRGLRTLENLLWVPSAII